MKLLITKNTYAEAKNSLEVSKDLKTVNAWSYEWWQYVKTDDAGNVIFNDSTYSVTTSGHQSSARRKLQELGITVNLWLHNTKRGLQHGTGPLEAINSEIKAVEDKIEELKELIAKKGTRKTKNEERKIEIKESEYRIKDLINFRDNYLDKKIYPVSNKKNLEQELIKKKEEELTFYKNQDYDILLIKREEREHYKNMLTLNKYKNYFLKDNKVLDVNSWNLFLSVSGLNEYSLKAPPKNLDALKELFKINLKPFHVEILSYVHLDDTLKMIQVELDHDNKAFINKAKRILEDHSGIINRLVVDKLHQILVNKMNKKTYTSRPRIVTPLAIPSKLLTIQHEKLKLIKTDIELKQEGKKQSHCIGSKHYIEDCITGRNCAVNFKGYTFLLHASSLQVVQTSGRFNSQTPIEVKNELENLLERAS